MSVGHLPISKVMYDVLAMIRPLGLPTWFFTLSAADVQWPVIQTIARQYGTIILCVEDIRTMSFENKRTNISIKQNLVTAAYHFQYHFNTFFHTFLKSPARPPSELTMLFESSLEGHHMLIQSCGSKAHLNLVSNLMKRCVHSLIST